MLGVSLLGREVDALASIYSFGILIAFMLVFASVVVAARARARRCRASCAWAAASASAAATSPCSRCSGLAMSWALWVLALGTHRAGRILPPIWLAVGLLVFVVMRRLQGQPLLKRIETVAPPPLEVIDLRFGTILVPLKQRGPIEEEMLAIACKLAQEQGARVLGVNVVEVPLSLPLDAPIEGADGCEARLRELTALFSQDYGVRVDFLALRSRAISGEIARVAREEDVGLILVGAVPHIGALAGRAQVFSETIENLLRRAHCRVIVTSFPPGTASVAEEAPEEPRIRPGPSPVVLERWRSVPGGGARAGAARAAASGRARRPRAASRSPMPTYSVRRSTTWASRLAPVAPAVIEAIAIARPVMPTRACRCAGAWRWRSPIAVVKLTHCARLSTIQTPSTCQNAVETASASTDRPLTTMPVTITTGGPMRPSSQTIMGPVAMPISEPTPSTQPTCRPSSSMTSRRNGTISAWEP